MAVLIRPEQPGDAAQLHENVCSANTLAEVEERITANLRTMRVGDQVHLVAEVDGVIAAAEGLIRNARGASRSRAGPPPPRVRCSQFRTLYRLRASSTMRVT